MRVKTEKRKEKGTRKRVKGRFQHVNETKNGTFCAEHDEKKREEGEVYGNNKSCEMGKIKKFDTVCTSVFWRSVLLCSG